MYLCYPGCDVELSSCLRLLLEATPGMLSRYDSLVDDRLGGIVAGDRADVDHVGSRREELKEAAVHVINFGVRQRTDSRSLRRHFEAPMHF